MKLQFPRQPAIQLLLIQMKTEYRVGGIINPFAQTLQICNHHPHYHMTKKSIQNSLQDLTSIYKQVAIWFFRHRLRRLKAKWFQNELCIYIVLCKSTLSPISQNI